MMCDQLDLDAVNLRIRRGSVPASTQLAETLKAAIVKPRVPRGGRLPSERELIDSSGLSRVTVRAAVGILERAGWLVRRHGLGTFVANPVKQELGSGVRTITEVLASSGITPQVDALSHRVIDAPPRIAETLGPSKVLCINRRFAMGTCPGLAYGLLPAWVGQSRRTVDIQGAPGAETIHAMESTYTMWEQRLGVRIAHAKHEIHAAGASVEVAGALDLPLGAPVLVLERISYTHDDRPIEVVIPLSSRAVRVSVTLPRTVSDAGAGIVQILDSPQI